MMETAARWSSVAGVLVIGQPVMSLASSTALFDDRFKLNTFD